MGKNEEKKQIVAAKPLVESGVGKMIQVIRGKQVLLDRDLATLYEVETKYINRAVKRNPNRFPDEFYFELTKEESLRCQDGTIKSGCTRKQNIGLRMVKRQNIVAFSAKYNYIIIIPRNSLCK